MPLTALRGKRDRDRRLTSPHSRRPSAFLSDRPKSSVLGVLPLLSPALRWFCYEKKILWEDETLPHEEFKSWGLSLIHAYSNLPQQKPSAGWLSLD